MGVIRDTFPEPIIYDPSGTAQMLDGVFDEAHEAVEMQGDVAVSSVAPVLWVKLADLVAMPTQGTALLLTSSGRTFEISDVQIDGAGGASLMLLETTP